MPTGTWLVGLPGEVLSGYPQSRRQDSRLTAGEDGYEPSMNGVAGGSIIDCSLTRSDGSSGGDTEGECGSDDVFHIDFESE